MQEMLHHATNMQVLHKNKGDSDRVRPSDKKNFLGKTFSTLGSGVGSFNQLISEKFLQNHKC